MKIIKLAVIALGLDLGLSGQESEIFFRARELPRPRTATIASVDVLSPSLRAAVSAKSDLAGVDAKGAFFRAPRSLTRDHGLAIASLNQIRAGTTIASATREFALVGPRVAASAVQAKPVELIVRVKQRPDGNTFAGLPITGWIEAGKLVRLTKQGPITAQELESLAAQRDVIEYAEPNHIFSFEDSDPPAGTSTGPVAVAGFPDDPHYANQEEWGMERINAPAMWRHAGTREVKVAVIDTGIDPEHEDLAANIDIEEGYNVINHSTDVRDDHGHGTHCAGVIGAVGNNGRGIAGINWRVKLMPIKAFDASGNGGTAFQIAEAIDFAIQHHAKVINASWGSPDYDDAIDRAVQRALAEGIVVVAAAGNKGYDLSQSAGLRNYPASLGYPGLISVMAINKAGERASFSNYGNSGVNIAAPGENIFSTWLMSKGGYLEDSGTSMAAPHVTGMVAALWSLGADRLEGLPATQAAQEIVTTIFGMAKQTPALSGLCTTGGHLYWEPARLLAYGVTPDPSPASAPVTPPPPAPAPAVPDPVPAAPPVITAVEVSGTLETGVPAIGGETTGTVLRLKHSNYELLPMSPAIKRSITELKGQEVTVKGKLKLQPGVERPNRTVLEIDSIQKK